MQRVCNGIGPEQLSTAGAGGGASASSISGALLLNSQPVSFCTMNPESLASSHRMHALENYGAKDGVVSAPLTRREALMRVGLLAAAGVLPAAAQTTAVPQRDGMVGANPADLVCLTDFEPPAQARMSRMAWEFVNAAAADETTLRWNREAYQRLRLRPRVLQDVSKLDTRITLFGHEHAFPILLAPTSNHKLLHPEGEIETARGARAADATLVISSAANIKLEDVASSTKGPLWFQLYVQRDRGFTRDLVQRAEGSGYRALCLTVDSPVLGTRNREARAGVAFPPLPNLEGLKQAATGESYRGSGVYSPIMDPSLSWKDVEWLRSVVKIPVLLKGVLNPEDADRAAKEGVAGIIVSNHGGRNLDTLPATIDALPLVVDKVAGRMPVLVDGGIRRGTDVLKALALGANAVLIGRPYLFGLSVAGASGVTRVAQILQTELQTAMALTGRTTIASVDKSVLWP
jgi:4-hydroxymandelate oxidase